MDTCAGSYGLNVPFTQGLFELAVSAKADERGGGYVGQITSNAFIKREFGERLIVSFLSRAVDLTHVVDTSGAFIPWHGTPTVILAGRQRKPSGTDIRTVRSIRGEPGEPAEPASGMVWKEIANLIYEAGTVGEWVSVDDLDRDRYFRRFPWILQDGGLELVEKLESASAKLLGATVRRIGFFGDTHADEIFSMPRRALKMPTRVALLAKDSSRGDEVRDWCTSSEELVAFPYDDRKVLLDYPRLSRDFLVRFWPWRTPLWQRTIGAGSNYLRSGKEWWSWHQLPRDDAAHNWIIAFAFVTTHNHHSLDRNDRVFNRSAPVIKLPEGATEDEHLRLLGVLNSSTACFWLKQVSHSKGNGGVGGGISDELWEHRYEFTGTKLQEFPLPAEYPLELARELDRLAQRLTALSPAAVAAEETPSRDRLADPGYSQSMIG